MATHVERVRAYADAAITGQAAVHRRDGKLWGGFDWGAERPPNRFVRDMRRRAWTALQTAGASLIRGDLDGQWQLLQTWDIPNKETVGRLSTRSQTLITCLVCSPGSRQNIPPSSFATVTGGTIEPHQRVFAASLRSPKGNFTLAVVNDANQLWDATIDIHCVAANTRLYRYDVSRADKDRTDLTISPRASFCRDSGFVVVS